MGYTDDEEIEKNWWADESKLSFNKSKWLYFGSMFLIVVDTIIAIIDKDIWFKNLTILCFGVGFFAILMLVVGRDDKEEKE